jgi:hypothetical protein
LKNTFPQAVPKWRGARRRKNPSRRVIPVREGLDFSY